MKKGEILEGIVKRVDYPGKGVVETPEGICIVKNVLPGQRVSLRVSKKRRGRAEGILQEVLEKAPGERTAPCPHFGKCGGCIYLNLPFEEELELKRSQVVRLLESAVDQAAQLCGLPAEQLAVSKWFEGIRPSPQEYEYRNKMEYTFGDEYKLILRTALDYFGNSGLPFYHRLRHTGYLRHLLVRKAAFTGEILVDLVTTTRLQPDLSAYVNELVQLQEKGLLKGRFAGILHTDNDSLADVVADQGTEILYGKDFFTEELLGLRFKVTPFSFFQTNSHGAEVLYDTARKYLSEGTMAGKEKGIVYDLYSGTGTIAQLMAPTAEKVIGVEIVEEAVEAAKVNAERNGLTNCSFLAGDVFKVLDTIEEKPDTIILDPPRDGIHPKALPRILSYGVENILYISCKPTSLARDLPSFIAAGYRPVRGICVDQFPWTSSVETLVLLSKISRG